VRCFEQFLRLCNKIFIELEAFDLKCAVFIKITRLFDELFREMEALIRNLRLFHIF
jgi:hypothetical protein